MHEVLSAAVERLGLAGSVPALQAASELSEQRVAAARVELETYAKPGFDVVGFGSLARGEMTGESDFDYLVLASQLPDSPDYPRELLEQVDNLRRIWAIQEGKPASDEVRAPGASGVFGRVVGSFDVIDQIGLQEDTNHSLTRRILLLEESVSLMNREVHDEVIKATLHRYLTIIEASTSRVPRFLLNDVVRYWRTITVDYQAKSMGRRSDLRYLKLGVPRKILFAGTLMSLMLCGRDGCHEATVEDLAGQFALPPLARLMSVSRFGNAEVDACLREILEALEFYLDRSGDADWRSKIEEGHDSDEFEKMKEVGRAIQRNLERIFFDWDELSGISRAYLAF